MSSKILTYDWFEPGALLGEWENTLDTELLAHWQSIFGQSAADRPAQAAGVTVVCMMRAYLSVVCPRPPGNIHTRQKFSLINMPVKGETILSRIWCEDKEKRKGRNYLYLETRGFGQEERPLYEGQMSLIWAA